MPTINQLVRQGRKSAVKKSGSPALGKNMNNLKKTSLSAFLIPISIILAIIRGAISSSPASKNLNRGEITDSFL